MAQLDFNLLKKIITDKYKEYFPNSFINVTLWDYEEPSISIYVAIGKDEDEFKSGYFQNDLMYNHLIITGFNKKKEFSSLRLEQSTPCSIRTVAPITHSAYYEPIEIPFKPVSGNKEKIVSTVEEFFTQLLLHVAKYNKELKAKFDIIEKLSKLKLDLLNVEI